MNLNLSETIALAKAGGVAALSQLYYEYCQGVYFIGLHIMENPEDAASVMQYSFLQAFHKLGILKNPENFKPWLYAIASNRCKTLLKERNPKIFSGLDDGGYQKKAKFTPLGNPDMLSRAIADYQSRSAVMQVVDKLPVVLRMAVILYYFCEMKPAQASKMLDCTEGRLKLYLSNAELQLKLEIDSLARHIEGLTDFSGMAEFPAILKSSSYDIAVPDDLSEDILSTAATLISSVAADTASAPPAFSETEEPEIQRDRAASPVPEISGIGFAPSDEKAGIGTKTGYSASGYGSLSASQKKNIRNIAVVAASLILTVVIISGSIMVIKNAADKIQNPAANTGGEDSTTVEAVSSDADTTESEAVPTDSETADAGTTAGESQTEVPETTAEPAATEPVPAETEPEPQPAGDTPVIDFTCIVTEENVTITRYNGQAKEVTIPPTIDGRAVTKISSGAFEANAALVSVTVPDTVKEIEDNAFRNCASLKTVNFPAQLTYLGNYAFYGCAALDTVKLPVSLAKTGASVFGGTPWLAAQSDAYLIVGDGVLLKYSGADMVTTVPDGTKYIANAFYYKNGLTSVELPSSVTEIGIYAFCGCAGLQSITIPESVGAIDKNAIYECKSLSEIKVKAGSYAEQWCKDNGFGSIVVTY